MPLNSDTKLQLLMKFSEEISKANTTEAVLELVSEEVEKILNAQQCNVFLIDAANNQLWSKIGKNSIKQEIRVPLGKAVIGLVAKEGKSIIMDDPYNDKRFSREMDHVMGQKTYNLIVTPINDVKGNTIGVIKVINKRDKQPFTNADEALLLFFGRIASRTIENAQLYDSLRRSQLETIEKLAIAAEFRDRRDTSAHIKHIRAIAYLLALTMGLDRQRAEDIRNASSLHDIGKVGIPDSILLKPGKLTEEEYSEIKKHTEYGAKILSNAESSVLQLAHRIAADHHERYDGTGYPNKKAGEEIALEARIVTVADVFDALCMPRIYKESWPPAKAYDYIVNHSGTVFDPKVVDAFKIAFPIIKKIYDGIPGQRTA